MDGKLAFLAVLAFVAAPSSAKPVVPVEVAPGLITNPSLQYHIQTDQGPNRFYRFQTSSGQFQKQHRNPDGSVYGSYGWVDPTGTLRLYEYVSDSGGYRIVKQSLYKVGKTVAGGYLLDTRAGPLNLGFEVYPLDQGATPHALPGDLVVGGPSGFRALHTPEGDFGLTPSFQVQALHSTVGDPANPLSKQGQATFFEPEAPLVLHHHHHHPIPEPEPEPIVIGYRRNDRPEAPAKAESRAIVIGYTDGDRPVTRARALPRPAAAAVVGAKRVGSTRRQGNASSRRSGIVIGRTAKSLFE